MGASVKRHAVLTSTYTKSLDKAGTLAQQSPSGAQSGSPKRLTRSVLAAIGISLFTPAYADAPVQAKQYISAKEYAAIRLDNKAEYICLSQLYGKESAWDDKAVNGSHYGIPQGRSIYLKTASKYEQIDWGLGYIESRYGTPCKAWAFFLKNNYH